MRTLLRRALPVAATVVALAISGFGPAMDHHHCYRCHRYCPPGWVGCPPNNNSHWS